MTGTTFVRYYISSPRYSLTQRLRAFLVDSSFVSGWVWIPVAQFDYEHSYGYLPGTNKLEVEYILRHCVAVLEHRDIDSTLGTSRLWKDPRATIVDDILLLTSIAKCEYIFARAQEILHANGELELIQRPIAPPSDLNGILPDDELGSFAVDSLTRIGQQNWKETTGFVPAVHWYSQAQRLHHAGEFALELSVYWIVLEVLARAHVGGQRLASKLKNKLKRVEAFVSSRGFDRDSWAFLQGVLKDCYSVRCAAFHEGKLPQWSRHEFEKRWRQLAEFTSLVLVDLLQPQSNARKNDVAQRLSSY